MQTAPIELLSAVAGQIADAAVAGLGDRVTVDSGGWSLADGPYVEVSDGSGMVAQLVGDGATIARGGQGQVDVYQHVDDEDPDVVTGVVAALDGERLTRPPRRIVRVELVQRIPDEQPGIIRTLVLWRYGAVV